jgi:hypothetical protein
MRRTSSRSAACQTCMPSSTNPTRPYTVNTIAEHLDMLMVCHHLDAVDPRGHRLRRKPHPQGDHRGRGHPARPRRALDHLVGQPGHGPRRRSAIRTWQTAHKMKRSAGGCRRRPATTTISACKRYIAKYTINPAIAHGVSKHRLDRGRQAGRPGAVDPGLLRREAGHGAGAARSPPRRWAIPTPRSRRRSRCTTGRCSAPMAGAGAHVGDLRVEGGDGQRPARPARRRKAWSRWRTRAAASPRRR